MPSVSSPSGLSSPPIVQGSDLRAVLLELPLEEVVVRGLTGEAVPVLREHHRDASSSYEVPHAVHAGALQGSAALAGVGDLLYDLVALALAVGAQGI